jgi:Tol biopolymer transport system component
LQSKAFVGGVTALAFGIVAVSAGPALADEQPGLDRVSVSSSGAQGNGASRSPVISGDGRIVVFSSLASNLVPDDYDDSSDIFVKDLATGELSQVGSGYGPSVSTDGRYIAFVFGSQVSVHDRELGTTTLASVATDGTPANGTASYVHISADGRYVVFSSTATTLAPGATGTNRKVFVRDLAAGTTTEVSVRPDGVSGSKDSNAPTISADGRYVAFVSQSKELVPGATIMNVNSVYVRDLHTGVTKRVNSAFVKGYPAISLDGRYVAFADSFDTLVPGDTNRVADVFRCDLTTGEMVRVNVGPDGAEANGDTNYVPQPVAMSANGQHVLFESAATNLVEGDTNARRDIFVRDLGAGVTSRLSGNSSDGGATAGNYAGSLTSGGGAAVFYSELSLTAEDTNRRADIYHWPAQG